MPSSVCQKLDTHFKSAAVIGDNKQQSGSTKGTRSFNSKPAFIVGAGITLSLLFVYEEQLNQWFYTTPSANGLSATISR